MKKYILLTIVSLITASCYSQRQLKEGMLKGKHDTFKVSRSKFPISNRNYMFVFSAKNQHPNGIPRAKNEFEISGRDIHVDQKLINKIITEVLAYKAKALHNAHEQIGGILIFDLQGNVTDVGFSVYENSIITPDDFEAMDNRIRSELKANFTGKAYLTHVAINSGFNGVNF